VLFVGLKAGAPATSVLTMPAGKCMPDTSRGGAAGDARQSGGIARQVFEGTGISGCVGVSSNAAAELFADVLCAGGTSQGPFGELDGPPTLPTRGDLASETKQELKEDAADLEVEEAKLKRKRMHAKTTLDAKKALDAGADPAEVEKEFGKEWTDQAKTMTQAEIKKYLDENALKLKENRRKQREVADKLKEGDFTKRPRPEGGTVSVPDGCRDQVAEAFRKDPGNVDPSPDDPAPDYAACAVDTSLVDICYQDWVARPTEDGTQSQCAGTEAVPVVGLPCKADLASTPTADQAGSLCDVDLPEKSSPTFANLPLTVTRALAITTRFESTPVSASPPTRAEPR
jgi:hypothetical protein